MEITLDLDFVRSQFPAFSESSLEGWRFFENAGGSYACKPVVDRLTRYYRETKVQPYGRYPASRRAGGEMDEARARLGQLLNAGPDELHFGPSTSQNTYVLAQAFRAGMSEGDEIIVTNQDHEANIGVWRRLAKTGIKLREWAVNPETGLLDPADLEALLNRRTRLVAFSHCSNIVAHINPVTKIAGMIHAAGAKAIVDGVSHAPHGLPDMAALDADVYLFSLYKTYGPHLGAMFVRRALLDELENQGHFFNAGSPDKILAPAGPDHAQIAAAAGLADYIDAVHDRHFTDTAEPATRAARVTALFQAHERSLMKPLLDYLSARNDVQVIGPEDPRERAPTIAVRTRRSAAEIAADLSQHRVMACAGDFYAVRLLEALGVAADPGVLRLSFVHYTSPDDIRHLIEALDKTL